MPPLTPIEKDLWLRLRRIVANPQTRDAFFHALIRSKAAGEVYSLVQRHLRESDPFLWLRRGHIT